MCVPQLSNVVVARLSVCGTDDAHAVAGSEVTELQQYNCQVVNEQLGVHQRHGKLDDTMVIFILIKSHKNFQQTEWSFFSGAQIIKQGKVKIKIKHLNEKFPSEAH